MVMYLIRFHGLRIERDGSGIWPMVWFYKPDRQFVPVAETKTTPQAEPLPAPASEPPKAEPAAGAPPAPKQRSYWTDYRGPRRDGAYDEMPILTTWPKEGPTRLWRKPIGGGYSSFVFSNGKAFTIEQRGQQEAVVAYDVTDGKQLWSNTWDALFQESMGGDGPRATPTFHEGRVFALGAQGDLRCLDADTGRLIWSTNILRDNGAQNLQWGMAGSPLIVDDKVIVQPGGSDDRSVVAYDRATGKPVWHALSDKGGYSSPMLGTLGGQRQILIVTGSRVVGLTTDGKLLWEYPWTTEYDINAAQPLLVGSDRFFISSGYGHGAALVQVTKSGDSFNANTIWQNTRMKNKFTTSVLHEGHVYGLDEAILACVNVETGDLKWKGGRYGYGQVIRAGGQLIVTTEDGNVAIVRASPSGHDEIVRFSAVEGKTWNHPAISDGVLLVRNGTEMSAFRVGQR